MRHDREPRAGAALLAVLWLSAALAAIAFSLASSVRGETERTATAVETLRAHYLATGAIERALLHIQWGPFNLNPDGTSRYYTPGAPWLRFNFPSGEAVVEIIPESGKMNVNNSPPEDLFHLLLALGVEQERAREIALAIVDWRSPAPGGQPTDFDSHYSALAPSFQGRHASFEEIEELLLVKGMTPELFYGTYERDREGRLAPRGALRDCLTVYGVGGQYDINTAEPAVLSAIGLSPQTVSMIVEARRHMPFLKLEQVQALGSGDAGVQRLRIGGHTIFTLRATARPRLQNGALSDARRTVAAVVKLPAAGQWQSHQVLRWYDEVWAP